ncbi:cation-translocating P-type ATPase [Saccharopolyspora elongata]|uniref:cation-translocating P-type ATPase n=1 Tax=Saccharopolyspora elongata TaxID=2530387 RepID=UPI0014046897|nr:cation-translocating P-type ATPase [Saccharopolyspora elongata]
MTEKLARLEGIRSTRVFTRTGNVVVWTDGSGELDELIKALQTPPTAPARHWAASRRAPAGMGGGRLVAGLLVLAGAAVTRFFLRRAPAGRGASGMFGLAAAFIGLPFLRRAGRGLARRNAPGTDALVAAATIVSLVLRQNIVAVGVLTVLNLGELVQALLLRNSRRHAARHAATEQRTWLVCDGVEVEVAASQVECGDVVAVHADQRIPVDGVVVEGSAMVDQSAIIANLLPVQVRPGDEVFAGTTVRSGALRIRASAVGSNTATSKLLARAGSVRDAREPLPTIAAGFAQRFTPAAFAAAGLTFLVTGDARRAMSMLLIACPCAVGLSTPTAVSAGVAAAARRDVHATSERVLEGIGLATAIVLGSGALSGCPATDATAVRRLRRLGVTRIAAFADDDERAAALARGLDAAELHIGDRPETRAALVHDLQTEGHVVAVLGRAMVDALALAQADIGITADTTLAPLADLVILGGDLTKVGTAVELGQRTRRIVRQNYGLSVGVNVAGMLAGAAGAVHPVLAAVLHNAGSAAVITNSARVRRSGRRVNDIRR